MHSEQDQVSNYQKYQTGYCEIMIKMNEIIIRVGQHTEIIQHKIKSRITTFFIEYNSDDKLTNFRYNINGDIVLFMAQWE